MAETKKSIFTKKHNLFRELIIAARKNASISQVDLAKKLKRPQSFVSKYERGERRLDIIEFLEVVKAIGINPLKIIKELERGCENHKN
ncbi:MAG: helix-turn-helix transcriptional regulator [Candidatus Riflebacteria bacterium]|nr:helix-turn-helix transcriptional regulator [Candidatus Riflebacteria bacterium]